MAISTRQVKNKRDSNGVLTGRPGTVYDVNIKYTAPNGEKKTYSKKGLQTKKEATQHEAEMKAKLHNPGQIASIASQRKQTVASYLNEWVESYARVNLRPSTYDGYKKTIANYINPIIGDMEVQAVTPRAVDGYIQTLQKTKSVSTKTRKAVTTYVSDKTIEKIIKLLRCAFKQAVRWEIIARNPFDNVILPKTEYAKRDIWTADMIRLALDKCTDSKLYVAMNLSFACSCVWVKSWG